MFDIFQARIPNGQQGYDVIATWTPTTIDGEGTFYTDSNGLGIVKRTVDSKSTEYSSANLRPSSNYYPINCGLMLEDLSTYHSMLVLNDRPLGGSAYDDNRIEFMINRRSYSDDGQGLSE